MEGGSPAVLLVVLLSFGSPAFVSASRWIDRASNQDWRYITSSSDGTKLAATVFNGNIWTSTDSGETWTSRASTQQWYGITSSSDGTKLAAVVNRDDLFVDYSYGGNIWTSTDSGETWTYTTNMQPGYAGKLH